MTEDKVEKEEMREEAVEEVESAEINNNKFQLIGTKFPVTKKLQNVQPKRSKHRKQQKGRIREVAKRGTAISFGSFALKALEPIWLTNRQIESARQAMTRAMKREGNVWIRIFPDKIITRKPAEVRMGKGKGNPEFWAAVVEPGRIIFECDGVTEAVAKEAMGLAAQKLPIATKFVIRRDLQA
jgi:large subunit ribosomal protein L16